MLDMVSLGGVDGPVRRRGLGRIPYLQSVDWEPAGAILDENGFLLPRGLDPFGAGSLHGGHPITPDSSHRWSERSLTVRTGTARECLPARKLGAIRPMARMEAGGNGHEPHLRL